MLSLMFPVDIIVCPWKLYVVMSKSISESAGLDQKNTIKYIKNTTISLKGLGNIPRVRVYVNVQDSCTEYLKQFNFVVKVLRADFYLFICHPWQGLQASTVKLICCS